MIRVGDVVQCVKPAEKSEDGLPSKVPEVGKIYRITGVYLCRYGLGCTLEGLDPYPFRGFCFYVEDTRFNRRHFKSVGRFFEKVQKADKEFTEMLKRVTRRRGSIDRLKKIEDRPDTVIHVYVDRSRR